MPHSLRFLAVFKTVALLMIVTGFTINVKAQNIYSISGNVKDDGGNLPGATVYINGSKLITACDNAGNYQFNKLSPGTYGVVVKMVGFAASAKSITIKGGAVRLDFKLQASSKVLGEVVIRAETNWEDHYQIFKKHFLGTTPNAEYCKIVNPKILYFHFDKATQVLSGSADEFLVIDNQALGYQIKYLLTNFEYNEQTNVLTYQGYPSFKELTPKSDKEAKNWDKNRELAYRGSILHFMRALYTGDVYTNGYEIYKVINKPLPGHEPDPKKPVYFDRRPVVMDSLVSVADEGLKTLTFKDALFVLNVKERESAPLGGSGYKIEKPVGYKIPNGQMSTVSLLDSSVTIDINGNYSDPAGLLFEGYMAWEQVADMIPLEYGKITAK
ncbi:carboxypeptidase-like regulatory domain-containing protein [Inquilinus sp. KBS0705]|nr:carboxypeptidase-like regulatory domain-containing protein [Inquilinus sp. KBS0705]